MMMPYLGTTRLITDNNSSHYSTTTWRSTNLHQKCVQKIRGKKGQKCRHCAVPVAVPGRPEHHQHGRGDRGGGWWWWYFLWWYFSWWWGGDEEMVMIMLSAFMALHSLIYVNSGWVMPSVTFLSINLNLGATVVQTLLWCRVSAALLAKRLLQQ